MLANMKRSFLLACAAALLSTTHVACSQPPAHNAVTVPMPRTTLYAGAQAISAEVANTPELRQIGLMHRTSLPANHGMLFVFEAAHRQCFWMKNTKIPLTIAFLHDDGRIASLHDMQPMSEQNHCSQVPVRYALEMTQGWFQQHGLREGDRITDTKP